MVISSLGDDGIAVGEASKDSNVAGMFELTSDSHGCWVVLLLLLLLLGGDGVVWWEESPKLCSKAGAKKVFWFWF